MQDFKIQLTRTATRHLEVVVQASTREEAEAIALSKAGDLEFPAEAEAEYVVESSQPAAG